MINVEFEINPYLTMYLLLNGIVILGAICRGYYTYWKENQNNFPYQMVEPVHIRTEYRDFEILRCENRIDRYYLEYGNGMVYDDMLKRTLEKQRYLFADLLEPFIQTKIIERDYETGDTIIRSEILVSKGLERR